MKINPCVEDLNEMTPINGGRFCSSCDKTIYDLREKTPIEINQLYLDNNGKLCGIVAVNQIPESKYYHPLKRFAFALLLVFGSTLFVFAGGYQADFERIRASVIQTISHEDATHVLTGFLYSDGKPLANNAFTVKVGEQTFASRTDKAGKFIINLPSFKTPTINMSIVLEPFETYVKTIDLKDSSQFLGKVNLTEKTDCIKMGKIAPPYKKEITTLGEIEAIPDVTPEPPQPPMQGAMVPIEHDFNFE